MSLFSCRINNSADMAQRAVLIFSVVSGQQNNTGRARGEVAAMRNSRRDFLQCGAALAAGAMGGVRAAAAESLAGREIVSQGSATVRVPTMKFGKVEIGRLVMGCNPFNGYAHFNASYSSAMRDWYTPERVCAVLHRAASFGINALNFTYKGHSPEGWTRFIEEGGAMHMIAYDSTDEDPVAVAQRLKPLALHRQGEVVDVAWRNGKMDSIRDWCKRARDAGVLVGVATHKPEVIAFIEEQGWDLDYFAGCVYNRTRSEPEWRKTLNGELLEMPLEIYLKSDPERMYKVMRQSRKPCFAFKILAAGRVQEGGVEQAFRTAFSSLKPIDGVFVGMFPLIRDEVKENAEIVTRVLAGV